MVPHPKAAFPSIVELVKVEMKFDVFIVSRELSEWVPIRKILCNYQGKKNLIGMCRSTLYSARVLVIL